MRLLVCGGGDFEDRDFAYAVLSNIHLKRRVTLLVHGAAPGAGSLAAEWAEANNIPTKAFPADWARHGEAAGQIRNRQMLEETWPDGVVAFPGGADTADMVSRAETNSVKVYRPAYRAKPDDPLPADAAPGQPEKRDGKLDEAWIAWVMARADWIGSFSGEWPPNKDGQDGPNPPPEITT